MQVKMSVLITDKTDSNKIYVRDDDSLKINFVQVYDTCTTESGCDSCDSESSKCFSCLIPSERPLLQEDQCVAHCEDGYF